MRIADVIVEPSLRQSGYGVCALTAGFGCADPDLIEAFDQGEHIFMTSSGGLGMISCISRNVVLTGSAA